MSACWRGLDPSLTSVLVVHDERRVSRHDGGAARQIGEHDGVHVHLPVPARHEGNMAKPTSQRRHTRTAIARAWWLTPKRERRRSGVIQQYRENSLQAVTYLGDGPRHLRQRQLVVPSPSVQLLGSRRQVLQRVVRQFRTDRLRVPSRTRLLGLPRPPRPRVMLALPSVAGWPNRLAVTLAGRG